MRTKMLLVLSACLAVPFLFAFQSSDQIDRKQLKDMLVQLGYDLKDLETAPGKEKYSFVLQRGGLDIPLGAEISGNGNYIWFTVFCKQGPPPADKAVNLLRRNSEIQPSHFYVTKSDRVMAAVSVENRGVTNTVLRQRAEKLAEDVAKTKDDWQ